MSELVIAILAFLNGIGNTVMRLVHLGWGITLFLSWLAGIALAQGFWSTVAAIFFLSICLVPLRPPLDGYGWLAIN